MSWLRSEIDLSGDTPEFLIKTVPDDEVGPELARVEAAMRTRLRGARASFWAPASAGGVEIFDACELVRDSIASLTPLLHAAIVHRGRHVDHPVHVTLCRQRADWLPAMGLQNVLDATRRLATDGDDGHAVAANLVLSGDVMEQLNPELLLERLRRHYRELVAVAEIGALAQADIGVARATAMPAAVAADEGPNARARAERQRREAILRDARCLTATEVADVLSPSGAKALQNPWDLASKLRRSGRLFGIKHGAIYLFPGFQFTDQHTLRPQVADLLEALKPALEANAAGWQAASWLFAPHETLNERTPAEEFARDPSAVIAAAREDFDPAARA